MDRGSKEVYDFVGKDHSLKNVAALESLIFQ